MTILPHPTEGGYTKVDKISYRLIGQTIQAVEITLSEGARIFTERGVLCWMKGAKMTVENMGVVSGIVRRLSGSSFFLTTFEQDDGEAFVALAPERFGPIEVIRLEAHEAIVCEKRAFLAASEDVSFSTVFQKKFSAGLFGGDGFILQRVQGPGVVFLSGAGVLDSRELGRGEEILVEPGHVSFFDESVSYSISPLKGFRNILFAGEGLFFAQLTGPGRIWLQGGGVAAAVKASRDNGGKQ